ncbi:MAG: hypothetical protein O2968_20775 [Acidobacteria bacterium]|nr:hypothetical protein [Acidobacteriota bacterium]
MRTLFQCGIFVPLLAMLTVCSPSTPVATDHRKDTKAAQPTASETAICNAMREALRSGPGATEDTPSGLSGDDLKRWAKGSMERARAYEDKAAANIAKEFDVSADEVKAIYVSYPNKYGKMCGL